MLSPGLLSLEHLSHITRTLTSRVVFIQVQQVQQEHTEILYTPCRDEGDRKELYF